MLLANPDMLLAGSTSYLLTAACKELEALLGPDGALDDTELLARRMIRRLRSSTQCSGLVGDAWALAQILMGFNHQERMWRVIQGVWVEMLCFSAARSRGYLHAKGLGSGGESLSYVWLQLGYAGMETYPDKLQKMHRTSAYARRSIGGTTPELLNRAFDEEHRSMLHTSQQPGQIPVLSTHTPLRSWRLDQRWTPRLARAGLLPLARLIQATEEDVVAQPAHGEPAHVERSRRFPFDSLQPAPVVLGRPVAAGDAHVSLAVRGDDHHPTGRGNADRVTDCRRPYRPHDGAARLATGLGG